MSVSGQLLKKQNILSPPWVGGVKPYLERHFSNSDAVLLENGA